MHLRPLVVARAGSPLQFSCAEALRLLTPQRVAPTHLSMAFCRLSTSTGAGGCKTSTLLPIGGSMHFTSNSSSPCSLNSPRPVPMVKQSSLIGKLLHPYCASTQPFA